MKYLIVLLLIGYHVSFHVFSQSLTTYESVYYHWDTEKYLHSFDRKFDSLGVITQQGAYHPLTVSFYGIMNYDYYKKTGNPLYLERFEKQYQFFKDTTRFHYFDNQQAIGLPYLKDMKALKAPWYSGMTQGVAVSFLLRYFELKKDSSALNLAKKMMKFMLRSEADGGTISYSADGKPWIEEYANYSHSKGVLNGFLNGLIGLNEYLVYFPEDTHAKQIHDQCYQELFHALKSYDRPAWTSYNKNNISITRGYFFYQLTEFDHLYHLYKDERFRDEMKLWAKFIYGHDNLEKDFQYYRYQQFKYGNPIVYQQEFELFNAQKKFSMSLKNIKEECVGNWTEKNKKIKLLEKTHYLKIVFNQNLDDKFKLNTFLKDLKAFVQVEIENSALIIQSEEGFDYLELHTKNEVKELLVYDYTNFSLPMFLYCDYPIKLDLKKGDKLAIKINGNYLSNLKVFYRFAEIKNKLPSAKYSIEQSYLYKQNLFTAPQDGSYEFFVVYDLTNPISGLKEFTIEKVK